MKVMKEQEDKFDVEADWVLPPVADLVPEGGRPEQEVRNLDNTYFDTSGAGLRVFGITLRRRVGGSETGWQLKVPSGSARTELQSEAQTTTVPAALAMAVAGLRAGESLDAVATIVTTRTAYRLLNADGELVMEIADDQVESGPPDGESKLHSWRELEVELGPAGKKKDLKRAGKLLRDAGASPGTARTKLDRALGPLMPERPATTVEPGTVGELIFAYLAAQCDVLASNDIALRTGSLVVHKTRVAVRRLRSTLRIFGDVFEAGPAEELDSELRWYADLLGQVRDQDVLSNRLSKKIADLPPEQVRGPAAAEITKMLAAEREKAAQRLYEGMDSERYKHLVLLLRGWRTGPPLSEAGAEEPAAVVTYAEKAKGKADKRLRKAEDDIERLHRARKATKRARYAAELAEPADGQMKDIARDAEELQTLLGEHQDAIVAAKFLARISSGNGAMDRSGFTYGVLMANELNHAAEIRASLKTS